MKKIIAGTLAAGMLIVPAMAQEVSVYLNNEKMIFDQNPIIENGRTLVPLRSIFEGLGAEVKWNPDIQEVTGVTDEKEVILRIGETVAKVNGENVTLDVAAKIENGYTLVPLRFISESLDAEVKWNAEEYRIDIEKDDFSAVEKNGKWGFENSKGEIVIPCIYDWVEWFNGDLAVVCKGEKCGYINKSGEEVIPCIYDYAWMFSEGLASVEKDGKYGYINKAGEEVIPCIYDGADVFMDGIAIICKDDKYGYINKNGEEVISCIYDSADMFVEGLAIVYNDGKAGYINKEGKQVIPFKYDNADYFNSGIAVVGNNEKYGCINKIGEEILPCEYDYISVYENIIIIEKNEKYGVWNNKGEEIISCEYDNIYWATEEIFVICKNDKYGCINKEGDIVIPCEYDYINEFVDGAAVIEKNEKYGYLNEKGEIILECTQHFAAEFSEGLGRVYPGDGSVIYIDNTGKRVIALDGYEQSSSFENGLAFVLKPVGEDIFEGIIDKTGKEIIPPIYNAIELDEDGNIVAEKDDKVYRFDREGNVI